MLRHRLVYPPARHEDRVVREDTVDNNCSNNLLMQARHDGHPGALPKPLQLGSYSDMSPWSIEQTGERWSRGALAPDELLQAEDGALDAGLRVRVVVLDAVQQLAQAPVRVRLHLATARAPLWYLE